MPPRAERGVVWMPGQLCVIERRREGCRAHYRAMSGPELVARSLGFDAGDSGADLAARDHLGRVLRALRWRPVEGGTYERL
jgi:hypothetical protein